MTDTSSRPNSKVARVIEAYDLDGLGAALERRWTGADGDRTSLRDLADVFNRRVLAAAMREADHSAVESDVESAYAALTDEETGSADRMRKRRDLEQAGIDVDAVLSDFVTHQAVHTYLTSYREAELPDRSEGRVDRKLETLERLQGRTAAVTESTVKSLVEAGELTDHDYELLVDVRAICSDCGADYAVSDLLRSGGCDCGES
ncbi:rod-determining factor RdfA [Halorubrum laminariae]|uniref:Rod-determining factor RdfA n=1 Tax=Halorubrum laminariae TaxID=1433523 RepID=A0ABD6C470_9EURY|nr:rod-determining factor RdfA [Halorubrum laminariae]